MTNKQKAIHVLDIIMTELGAPQDATLGDIAWALSLIDEDGEVMSILQKLMRDAVIDEIKAKI